VPVQPGGNYPDIEPVKKHSDVQRGIEPICHYLAWGSANALNSSPPGSGERTGVGREFSFALVGARGGAPPPAGRAPTGAWRLVVPRRDTKIEKNGRFRWAVEGCWDLQMRYGVGRTPLEVMGG
jgi:hypothetical protein